MGLQDAISVSFVDPIRDERGWRFSGDGYVDSVNGYGFLSEAYLTVGAGLRGSGDRSRAVGQTARRRSSTTSRPTSCGCCRRHSRRWPSIPSSSSLNGCAGEIEALNRLIYDNVNNAVYKAGFASTRRGSTSAR